MDAPVLVPPVRQPLVLALAPGGVPKGAPVPEPPVRRPEGTPVTEQSARQPVALVPDPVPDAVVGDLEDSFDPGPPADAILDFPYDAETFDDGAHDTEEEYPCDEEAC